MAHNLPPEISCWCMSFLLSITGRALNHVNSSLHHEKNLQRPYRQVSNLIA